MYSTTELSSKLVSVINPCHGSLENTTYNISSIVGSGLVAIETCLTALLRRNGGGADHTKTPLPKVTLLLHAYLLPWELVCNRYVVTGVHATICFCVMSSAYEEIVLVGSGGVYHGDSLKFRRNILPASSGLSSQPSKYQAQSISVVSCIAFFSALKMEAIYYSETTQRLRTTRSKKSINPHQFMRHENSVPCSQDSATGLYSEPDESSLHLPSHYL
jgi:hypothetical protein